MGEQPPGQAGEYRGIGEGEHPHARETHTERRRRRRAATQGADRPADPAVQQVTGEQKRQGDGDPHHRKERPAVQQRPAPELQRRHAGNAVVAAQHVQIAEHVEERHAPRDSAKRQVVAGQPQRHRADYQGGQPARRQGRRQGQPGRPAELGGQQRRGVGAEAHERGLAEGRDAGHAREHDDADRHDGRNPGVVGQRQPIGWDGRNGGHAQPGEQQDGQGAAGRHSSSSATGLRRERTSSTGRMMVKTITSLNALAQKLEKLSTTPTNTAASTASG